MQKFNYPPSNAAGLQPQPDICFANGHLYFALPTAAGLDVYQDGALMVRYQPGCWPRFGPNAILAYKDISTQCLAVSTSGTTPVFCQGNSPICWSAQGVLAVNATTDNEVWADTWPMTPGPPPIRTADAAGLAQFLSSSLISWNEMNALYRPEHGSQPLCLSPSLWIGQAESGGIQITLNGVTGVLEPGTATNDPRGCVLPDGSLALICWHQGSQGSLGWTVWMGVTAADLQSVDAIPPVVPYPESRILAAFLHQNAMGQRPTWCNAWIDEGLGGGELIGDHGQHWTVVDVEQNPEARHKSPACYIGTFDRLVVVKVRNPYDIRAVEIYREPNESDSAFETRAYAYHVALYNADSITPIAFITNNTTRLLTLTERDVQAAQAILSRFDLPMFVFEWQRPFQVEATNAQFTAIRNGQPCPPQILPPPDPEPDMPVPKQFKNEQEKKAFCNIVGQRYGKRRHTPPSADDVHPDTGLSDNGQHVWGFFDKLPSNFGIPQTNSILDGIDDVEAGASDAQIAASFAYENPVYL